MAGLGDDFELLFAAVDPTTADLARGLLDARGIPSLLHGPDFDVAELGVSAHRAVRHQDLYVARGARAAARSVLAEAWGETAVAAHERAGAPQKKPHGRGS